MKTIQLDEVAYNILIEAIKSWRGMHQYVIDLNEAVGGGNISDYHIRAIQDLDYLSSIIESQKV